MCTLGLAGNVRRRTGLESVHSLFFFIRWWWGRWARWRGAAWAIRGLLIASSAFRIIIIIIFFLCILLYDKKAIDKPMVHFGICSKCVCVMTKRRNSHPPAASSGSAGETLRQRGGLVHKWELEQGEKMHLTFPEAFLLSDRHTDDGCRIYILIWHSLLASWKSLPIRAPRNWNHDIIQVSFLCHSSIFKLSNSKTETKHCKYFSIWNIQNN